jgi:hypothetical protein
LNEQNTPQTPEIFFLDLDYTHFKPGDRLRKNWENDEYSLLTGIFCVIAVIVIGVFLAWGAVTSINRNHKFNTTGVKTQATIVQCRPNIGRNGGFTKIEYTYSIPIEGGNEIVYENDDLIDGADLCPNFPVGGKIDIWYLPNNPGDSEYGSIIKGNEWGGLFAVLALGGGMAIFFLYAAWKSFITDRRFKRLSNQGILLKAEIVDSKWEYARSGRILKIGYQFMSPSNKLIKDSRKKKREDLSPNNLPQAGTVTKVLYAADDCHIVL